MAYEQRAGDISIFAATDKTNEKAPDWKGTMIVPDGVKPGDKLEVAMWAKGERGTMLAGSAKPPRQQSGADFRGQRPGGGGATPVAGNGGGDPFSDEVPFVHANSIL